LKRLYTERITNKTDRRKGIAQARRFGHDPRMSSGIEMVAAASRHAYVAETSIRLTVGDGGPGMTPIIGTVAE